QYSTQLNSIQVRRAQCFFVERLFLRTRGRRADAEKYQRRRDSGLRNLHSRSLCAFMIASDSNGMRLKLVPVACSIAFRIAGPGPSIGSSPIPFAPPGPKAYGFTAK